MYITPTLIFYSVCVGMIIGLLYLLSCLWPPDSPWSPWWKTFGKDAYLVADLAHITKKDVVYELGSGDGEFITYLVTQYAKHGIGVEIDPVRHRVAKYRKLYRRIPDSKLVFLQKNFFDVDLSSATVVYVYLVPKALERLLPKLKKELKPGTRVVSYRYQIPSKKYIGKKAGAKYLFYLYKI